MIIFIINNMSEQSVSSNQLQNEITEEVKQNQPNPNKDDDSLPCYTVGKLQEAKMLKFLSEISSS